MLSVDQIKTYNTDGLVKSSTQLSSDKIKDLNSALDKYLEDHKGENNEFTAEKLQKMFEAGGVEKSKVEELIGPPTKLYALHICHKNCERKNNSDVGGGSVTFVKAKYDGDNKVRTEYFARLTGGSTTSCEKLCAMEIPIKSDEPDKRNISLKNPRLDSELKLRISRDKIEIEDSLVEISHWPRRINDQDKNQIIDFLENQIGNKVSPDSMKISLSQKFDTGINGNRLYKYEKIQRSIFH